MESLAFSPKIGKRSFRRSEHESGTAGTGRLWSPKAAGSKRRFGPDSTLGMQVEGGYPREDRKIALPRHVAVGAPADLDFR